MTINILPFSKVLTDVTKKFTKIKKQDYLENGKYPIIDQGQDFICGYTDNENAVNFEDIPLIIFGDHTKVFKYIDFPIAIGADGVKALMVDSSIAETKFIYYYLKSLRLHDAGYSRHFKYLKAKKIPLPKSIDDQIKIANLLSQVETLIAKREESINLLDELLKSTFLDMFGDPVLNGKGWEMNFMKDITKKITDGTHKSPPMSDTGYKYITAKHIKKNNIIDFDSNPTYIEKKYHDEIFSRCNPQLGDILYIKDGATTGIACINKINEEFSLLSSVALLKPNKKINNYYLLYFLNIAKKKLIENMAGGAIKRLTLKKIKLIKVPLPPKPLQDKFATIVQQVEESKKRYHESLNQLHQLFGSLSQRAFKGELDLSRMVIEDDWTKQALAKQKAYEEATQTKVYESGMDSVQTVSIKHIPKENIKDYLLSLIKLNTFDIDDISHHIGNDFTFDELKQEFFNLLNEGKIKQIFDEDSKKIRFKVDS